MDFDRLRYFCVIAETGSLRRAAEILRVSPPALSKAVRILEGECGHTLLVPAGRGIAITDAGRLLAGRARAILEELKSLRGDALSQQPAARPLRLGTFEVFSTYFLGPLARRELGDAPLVLHELVAGHLERALVEREVDLGLTYVAVPSGEIEHTVVTQIEMGIFARRGAFLGTAFEQLPFAVPVTPLSGSPDRIRGQDGWPEERLPRQIRYEVALMESALELCRQGLSAAFLPRFVARLHNERVRPAFQLAELSPLSGRRGAGRELLRSSRQSVYLLRRRSEAEGPLERRIARAVRAVCGPSGQPITRS